MPTPRDTENPHVDPAREPGHLAEPAHDANREEDRDTTGRDHDGDTIADEFAGLYQDHGEAGA